MPASGKNGEAIPDMNKITAILRNNSALFALLLVSFLVYIPSLSGDFVVDDTPFVKDNPYIRDFSHISRFFTKGLIENSAFETNVDPRYLPMALVPMMLNHAIWGANPFGYHLFTLLLHLANVCLIYVLIRRLTACSATAATVGAALFALHPTKVESVAWISGGIDPLAAFLLLGALLAHHSFANSGGEKTGWRYLALSLFCFQLALWSKEVAITFPFIVAAYDLIYHRKINRLALSLYAALAAAYLAIRSLVLGTSSGATAFAISQLPQAIDFALGYGELLVFPSRIPFYLKTPEHAISSALGWVAILVIIVAIGYFWRFSDSGRKKTLLFSLIWIAGFFWPAVVMAFYEKGFFFARWLYIPSIGVSLFAAAFYAHLTEKYPKLELPLVVSCALVVSLYGFFTWKEIPSWRNDEAFYGKVVSDGPESPDGYCGLGQFYFLRDDYIPSENNFQLCLQKAKTLDLKADVLVKLGTIHGMTNNLDLSEKYLSEAIRIAPRNSEGLTGLGNLALMRGQTYKAISFYEEALAARPKNHEAAMNLAMTYERIGQTERAEQIRRTAP